MTARVLRREALIAAFAAAARPDGAVRVNARPKHGVGGERKQNKTNGTQKQSKFGL